MNTFVNEYFYVTIHQTDPQNKCSQNTTSIKNIQYVFRYLLYFVIIFKV